MIGMFVKLLCLPPGADEGICFFDMGLLASGRASWWGTLSQRLHLPRGLPGPTLPVLGPGCGPSGSRSFWLPSGARHGWSWQSSLAHKSSLPFGELPCCVLLLYTLRPPGQDILWIPNPFYLQPTNQALTFDKSCLNNQEAEGKQNSASCSGSACECPSSLNIFMSYDISFIEIKNLLEVSFLV